MLEEPIVVKKNRKNYKKIILVICFALISLIGGSYAFFQYFRESDRNTTVIAGSIYLEAKDNGAVSLSGMYPMTDEDGKENGVKYNFNIKGHNESEKDLYYGVYINNGKDVTGKNRFSEEDIKLYLTETNNGETSVVYGPGTLKDFNNKLIYANVINAKTNKDDEVSLDYELTMWIDEKVLISDTLKDVEGRKVYTSEEFKNSYASVKADVYGDFKEKEVNLDINASGILVTSQNIYDVNKNYVDTIYASENVKVSITSKKEVSKFVITNAITKEVVEKKPTFVDEKYVTEIEYSQSGSYTYYGVYNDGTTSTVGTYNVKVDKVVPSFEIEKGETYNLEKINDYYKIENNITNINDDNEYILGYALVEKDGNVTNYTKVEAAESYKIVINSQTGLWDLVVKVTDESGKEKEKRESYTISYNAEISLNNKTGVTLERTTQKLVKGQRYDYIEALPVIDDEEFVGYAIDPYGQNMVNDGNIVADKVEKIYAIWDKSNISIDKPTVSYCDSVIYNGSSQTLTKGTGFGYSFTGNTGTNVGNYEVKAVLDEGYVWSDGTNNDVTITCSIAKLPITYKADDASKVYDGTALTKNTAILVNGSLVSGHTASFEIEGTITNVGTATNTLKSVIIRNSEEVDVTENYEITKQNGTLSITASGVVEPTVSYCNSLVYSGSSQVLTKTPGTGYTFSGNTGTNAGEYIVTASLIDGYSWSFGNTDDVTFKCSIAKKDITYKADDASKVYDGTALTKNSATLVEGSLVTGHEASFEIEGTITNAGTATNTLVNVIIKNSGGTDVSENYNITKQNGTLTVTKVPGTVELEAKDAIYTGSAIVANTAKTNSNATISYTYYNGENCSGTALSSAPTAVGTYSVKATVVETTNYTSATSSCVKHIINHKTYNVTLNNQSATTAGTETLYGRYGYGIYLDSSYSNNLTEVSNPITIPIKTGYIFGGYYTAINGGGTQMITATGYRTSDFNTVTYSSNVTLYAKWTIKPLKIYFNTNGGTLTKETNGTYTADSDGFVLKNGSLYIQTISGGSQTTSDGLWNPDHTQEMHITKTGFNPKSGAEWNTKADGTGTSYSDSPVYTYDTLIQNATENSDHYRLNLYVNWDSSAYTVTYNGNKFSTLSTKTQNGLTGTYDPDTSYLTLDGTPTGNFSLMQLVETFITDATYRMTLTYVSGSYTTSGNLRLAAEVYDASNAYLSTRNYVAITLPKSGTATDDLVITSLDASKGKYLYTSLWIADTTTTTFTNYKVKVNITKVDTKNVTYNGTYGTLGATPTRYGYYFAGWYTAESGGTQVTTSTKVTTASNHTLYAHWTEKPIKVYYNVNGGNVTETTAGGTFAKDSSGYILKSGSLYNQSVNLTSTFDMINCDNEDYINIIKTGYVGKENAEWNTKADGTGTSYNHSSQYSYDKLYIDPTLTDNNTYYRLNVYVNWIPKTYSIVLNNQSASTVGTTMLYGKYATGIYLDSSYSKNLTETSNPITLPTKTGYTFGGYYTATNGGGTQMITATGYRTSNLNTVTYSDNVTLYAKWTAKEYTITLNNQSATTAGTTKLYGKYSTGIYLDSSYSKNLTEVSNPITIPARTGYIFGGYYTATNGGGTQLISATGYRMSDFSVTSYSGNVTLYAKWTMKPLKIYYNTNGGTLTEVTNATYTKDSNGFVLRNGSLYTQTISGGADTGSSGLYNPDYTEQMHITKTGYGPKSGSEWNTKSDGTGTSYSDSTLYTYDTLLKNATENSDHYRLNLYVNWNASSYTVTYNGNKFATLTSQTQSGVTITYDPETSYLTLNGTPNSNIYYMYLEEEFTSGDIYRTTLDYVSGSWTAADTSTFTTEVRDASKATLSTRVYKSTPWPSSNDVSRYSEFTVSDLAQTKGKYLSFYMHFAEPTTTTFTNYKIKVNITKVDTQTVTYNGTYGTLGATPTRYGYYFAGWYTAESGGTQVTTSTKVTTASNHTLYAHWTEKPIKVYYNVNGGNVTETTAGGTFAKDSNGYILKSGSLYNQSASIDSNIDMINYNNDEYIYVSKTGYVGSPGKEWNTKADGSGTSYNDSNEYSYDKLYIDPTLTDNNTYYRLNVYVNWIPKTYSIVLNNQSASTVGTTMLYGKYATGIYLDSGYSTNLTETSNPITLPTKTGYTFGGYYTAANGGGTQMITATGYRTSNFNTVTYSDNVTLYAKWTPNTYTITLNNQSATTAGTTTLYGKYAYGIYLDSSYSKNLTQASNPITIPTRTGYIFDGYYTATNGGGTQLISATGYRTSDFSVTSYSSNVTLYAKWTMKPLKIYYNVNGGTLTEVTNATYTKDSNGFVLRNDSAYIQTVSGGADTGSSGLYNPDYTEQMHITKTGYGPKSGSEWNTKSDGTGTSYSDSTLYTYDTLIQSATENSDHYRLNLYVNWNASSYTVTYNGNKFGTLNSQTLNGVTITYDQSTSYLTLNGTPTGTLNLMYLSDTFTSGDKYKATLSYVSGSFVKDGTVTFTNEIADSSKANLSTRNYGSVSWPTSTNTEYSNEFTISDLAQTNGKYLRTYMWFQTPSSVTFTNYKIKVNVTKVDTKTVTYNSTYGTLGATPTRYGYYFAGWYTAESGGTQVATSTKVTTASNHTLYAHWTEKPIRVYYNVNNGSITETTDGGTFTKDSNGYVLMGGSLYNQSVKINGTIDMVNYDNSAYIEIKKTGYIGSTGKEWNTMADGSGTSYNDNTAYPYDTLYNDPTLTDNGTYYRLNVYVNWIPKTYTITLNNQSATTAGTTTLYGKYAYGIYLDSSYSKNLTQASNPITIPTRTGYIFDGYYTATNGGGTQLISATGYRTSDFSVTSYSSNVTLYAKWTMKPLKIYYNVNGGALTEVTNATYTKDSNGFVLRNGSAYTQTISGGADTGSSGLYNPDYTEQMHITKTGYGPKSGSEWNTKSDGTGTSYSDSTLYTYDTLIQNATENSDHYRLNLYVNWNASSYTVTYNGNKFGTLNSQTLNGVTITYDQSTSYLTLNGTPTGTLNLMYLSDTFTSGDKYKATLSYVSGSFVKDGTVTFTNEILDSSKANLSTRNYGSVSWPTSTNTEYSSEFTISDLAQTNGKYLRTYMYFATPSAVTFTNYKIKVNVTKVDTKTVTYNSTYGTLGATPTRYGHYFAGWYTAESGGTQVTTSTKVTTTSNHTLYAHWYGKPIRIYYNVNSGDLTEVTNATYTTDNSGFVLKNDNYYIHTVTAGSTTGSAGLWNYNNTSEMNISKYGYYAKDSAEWNTKADGSGTSFNDSSLLTYDDLITSTTDMGTYYRLDLYVNWTGKNIVIYYNANSGTPTASTSGGTYGLNDYGFVTRNGSTITTTVSSGGQLGSSGLDNYNNSSYMNITRSGYVARSGTPWNSKSNGSGVKYSQSTVYTYAQLLSDPNILDYNETTFRLYLYVDWLKVIEFTADSASKPYDGTALTANTASITSGSLLSGHTVTYNITGSQTSVGSSDNTLNSVTIKDSSGNNVNDKYSITLKNGTLTVTDSRVCEWKSEAKNGNESCTATAQPSNPSEGDTYITCGSYKRWKYSLSTIGCVDGYSINASASGYTYTSEDAATTACNSTRTTHHQQCVTSHNGVKTDGTCTNSSKTYYTIYTNTYTCE